MTFTFLITLAPMYAPAPNANAFFHFFPFEKDFFDIPDFDGLYPVLPGLLPEDDPFFLPPNHVRLPLLPDDELLPLDLLPLDPPRFLGDGDPSTVDEHMRIKTAVKIPTRNIRRNLMIDEFFYPILIEYKCI